MQKKIKFCSVSSKHVLLSKRYSLLSLRYLLLVTTFQLLSKTQEREKVLNYGHEFLNRLRGIPIKTAEFQIYF